MEFKGAKAFLMIPVGIARDKDLLKKPKTILLMGEIVSMFNVTGEFFMSNAEIARRLDVTIRSVKDYLVLLEKKKLIKRTNVYADKDQKVVIGRKITAGDDLGKYIALGWGSSLPEGGDAHFPRVGKHTSPKYNKLIDQSNKTNNRSSSSSKPSSEQNEITDPFTSASDDDDEKIMNGLIDMFIRESHISAIPSYQRKQILNNLSFMDHNDAIDLMYTVINKVSGGMVKNPIGYLMTSITTASVMDRGGGTNGSH